MIFEPVMTWKRRIDFGVVEAACPAEAMAKIELRLAKDRQLLEEDAGEPVVEFHPRHLTHDQIRALHPGDQVTWLDPLDLDEPGEGTTRTDRILRIDLMRFYDDHGNPVDEDDAIVRITWADGSEVECYWYELC